MRKIIIFYIFLYLVINQVYALPLLGVVPFVFDFGLLIFLFLLGIINSTIFFILKKIKILNKILILIDIFGFFILYYIVGYYGFIAINLSLSNGYYIKFYFILFLLFFFIILLYSLLTKINKDFINYIISILLIIIFGMLFNILFNMYNIFVEYNNVINKLNNKTNNSVVFTSNLVFNNILISRDLKYNYNGNDEKCRITISYYKHNNVLGAYSKFAPKTDKIHLYIGLSSRINGKSLCRYLIEK